MLHICKFVKKNFLFSYLKTKEGESPNLMHSGALKIKVSDNNINVNYTAKRIVSHKLDNFRNFTALQTRRRTFDVLE